MKYSIDFVEKIGRKKQHWNVYLAGTGILCARIYSNSMLRAIFKIDGAVDICVEGLIVETEKPSTTYQYRRFDREKRVGDVHCLQCGEHFGKFERLTWPRKCKRCGLVHSSTNI